MHSFIKVINEFIPMERQISLRENWLIFWGIWEKAELFFGTWGAKTDRLRRLV